MIKKMADSMKIMAICAERNYDNTDYKLLDSDDIFFIGFIHQGKIKILTYHTIYGKYHPIGTLEGYRVLLEDHGFCSLDTVNVVNMNKIQSVVESEAGMRVYFEDGSSTTVSRAKSVLVKNYPRKTIE
ncbi:LytTR family transcriptional regulator DNA-binding domain-containing protein [Brevibacillus laterosporus]|uniref:LytTR family transcriptional regulator DNA-binding domain-containing protein n=1 Tax=Brevibacillus laterosporus TaxID=1465 RepID=UPI003D261F29